MVKVRNIYIYIYLICVAWETVQELHAKYKTIIYLISNSSILSILVFFYRRQLLLRKQMIEAQKANSDECSDNTDNTEEVQCLRGAQINEGIYKLVENCKNNNLIIDHQFRLFGLHIIICNYLGLL